VRNELKTKALSSLCIKHQGEGSVVSQTTAERRRKKKCLVSLYSKSPCNSVYEHEKKEMNEELIRVSSEKRLQWYSFNVHRLLYRRRAAFVIPSPSAVADPYRYV
jgi:hypothetical protein